MNTLWVCSTGRWPKYEKDWYLSTFWRVLHKFDSKISCGLANERDYASKWLQEKNKHWDSLQCSIEIWWLASSFSLTEVDSSFTDNHATKDHTNFSLSNSFTGPDLVTFLKERSIIPLQGTFIAEGSTPTLKPVNSAAQASQSKSSCSASNIG